MKIILSIFADLFFNFVNFIVNNLKNFARILKIILPFSMYFLGQYLYSIRQCFSIGYELLIVVIVGFVIYFFDSLANKLGKGISVPIPKKRFTTEEDEGEVFVDNNRIQELILYVNDLENWLERKGLL